MKLALAILTVLGIFSFLYFLVAALVAMLGARLERQPFPSPKTSFVAGLWDGGPYTERGKELMARYYRNFFFAFASGAVMLVSGAGYVHLRDGAVGPSPFKSPAFVAAPAIVFGNALIAFLGCALWLAGMPGTRCATKAARRIDDRRSTPADRQEFEMDDWLLRHCGAVARDHAAPIGPIHRAMRLP